MIQKILSGGQSGTDRAALDAAVKLGIPRGGWIPKGHDGSLSKSYKLREMPTESQAKSIRQNIMNANGTLIISHGKLRDTSALTRDTAKKNQRPCLHIDLDATPAFQAGLMVVSWIEENDIAILYVTGPGEDQDPKSYQSTFHLLESVYYISLSFKPRPGSNKKTTEWGDIPGTVDEAVNRLVSEMPFKDKVTLANMAEVELDSLRSTLGKYIRYKFGLWKGNPSLMESCRFYSGRKEIRAETASDVIIGALWKRLKGTHKLRVVK